MSFTADGVQGVMGDSGGSDPNPRGHVSQASGGGEVYMRGKNGWSELCEGQREESSRQGEQCLLGREKSGILRT